MSDAESSDPERGDSDSENPGETTAGVILDQVVTLVVAITIALAIRQFLVEPFRIPSGSMFPTLLIGDHLFVNKLSYGPRIPFTDIRVPGLREPERGDVVVFEVARPLNRRTGQRDIQPVDYAPEGAPREDFVKRLVGLPGDKIDWRDGQLVINGVRLPVESDPNDFEDDSGRRLLRKWEDLGACRHQILDDPRKRIPSSVKDVLIVPEGRYFFMGDNRENSNDSRGWGTVRLEELKGPAFILYWSWDVNGNMMSFFNPINWWSSEKRWDRVFDRVRCDEAEAPVALTVSAD
ncbi:MAG: signal peptidase I [Myxococcota bacterium]